MIDDADTIRLQTLMRILYDPLSWLDVSAIDPCTAFGSAPHGTPWVAWKNQTLIDSHALTCSIDFDPLGATLRWWIDHWWQLRRIAYLMGCRIARASLIASTRYARLDPVARAFVLSPVLAPPLAPLSLSHVDEHPVARHEDSLECPSPIDLTLVTQGYRCLHAHTIELPRALGQRLDLMFSDARDVIDRTGAPPGVIRFQTLIESATYHATLSAPAPCAPPA